MKTGIIEFSGRTIACLIRNQSETGAGLEVVSPVGIPAQFTLLVGAERISCTVIWRTEKLIGVKFNGYVEGSQKRFGGNR
ncbi:PilZ domain-containing protein [Bradyrhizobium sp. AUGA SZCCT0431]|uniref:PilZ domain-containing protein n=1 Tax=Bradyrhizobium sp. AUGA SZCCT0431 TaxID=2807674 RepID=UPI001BA6295B|nr:PilZ domain-containing protein [Bradyrhizobium sp. AUGA SZCCT0431]MBR1148029.1 PilZ domain-containing protein [Bradyrhizobium sp. AUGA SZCCT0431]